MRLKVSAPPFGGPFIEFPDVLSSSPSSSSSSSHGEIDPVFLIDMQESSFLPSMSQFRLEYFRNSRLVEVAAIFDTNQRITGGGFLLRDEAHEPLLARAFPIAGGTFIFTEAVAVRQAIEEMLRLGEERLIICSSSMALLRCFHGSGATGSSAADGVVGECIELFRRAPRFHLVCVHEEELVAPRWLAQTGAQSQQHIQWDKPLMDELSGKLEA